MAGIHFRPSTPVEGTTDTQADSAAVTQRTGSLVQSAATGGHPVGGNTASQVKLLHHAQTSEMRTRQNYLSQVDELQKNVPSELKGDIRDILRSSGQKIPSETLMSQTLALPEAVHFEVLAAAGGKVTDAMVDSAIAEADARSMERLLATGSNPNAVGANGRAVLTRALMAADASTASNPAVAAIVDILIKTPGINLDHAGPHKLTAVHFAAFKPNVDAGTLKKLVDAGASTSLQTGPALNNTAPAHLATQSLNLEALKVLVAAPDYNPHLKDAGGNTALDLAKQNLQVAHDNKDASAVAANQEMITLLSARQVTPVAAQHQADLAALNAGHIADASINTDLPADNMIAIRNYLNNPVKQRSTAAHMGKDLTRQLNVALTEKLTQNKPIPEQVMTSALSIMPFEQVSMLVKARGDLTVRSKELSNSALMMVMARFDQKVPPGSTRSKEEFYSLNDVPAILSMLINEGKADVNSPNRLNMTPLSRALVHGEASATKVLLDAGADVNYRGPSGRNIMHDLAIGGDADVLAQFKNNPEVLRLKETEDNLGNPPIFCTIGHEDRAGGLKPNPAAFQFFQDIGVSVHSPNSNGTRMMDVSFEGHLSEEQTLILVQANAHASQSEKNGDNRLYALMDHPHADRVSFIDNVIRPQLPAFIATGGDPNILELNQKTRKV